MILIVGSQRTGSTLMSLILDSHPSLRDCGDPDLPLLLEKHDNPYAVYHAVIWTARYKWLHEANPNHKYVFMLRNLYAISSSMMSLRDGNTNWAKAFSIEEIARSIIGVSDWRRQYQLIPILGELYRTENVAKMAVTCAYLKSYMIEEYRQHNLSFLPVRYEDLVTSPEQPLSSLMEFLGHNWDDDLLRHHELHSGFRLGNTIAHKRISPQSIGIWKHNLTDENIRDMRESVSGLDNIFDGFADRYKLI